MKIKTRPINFSKWYQWDDWKRIHRSHLPGVYIIAIFKKHLPVKPNLIVKEIIYVGETCSRDIHTRLSEFNRSAFSGKLAHAGGSTFRKKRLARYRRKLFVSVAPVRLPKFISDLFIRYVERKIMYDYARKYGRRPICNIK